MEYTPEVGNALVQQFYKDPDSFLAAPEQPPTKSLSNHSKTWGKLYQSESDQKKMESFDAHETVPLVEGVEQALDTALTAFVGDKGITDQTTLRELLVRTAQHESLGGKLLEQDGGKGPARGAWQVEPETARDIIKSSGLLGEQAESILGMPKEKVLALSDDDLNTLLKDHANNAVFAVAKYLQAADAKGMLKDLQ